MRADHHGQPVPPAPQLVRREVDVTLELGADGARVVDVGTPAPPAAAPDQDPCLGCACCTSWAAMLELVRAAAQQHKNPHPLLGVQCPGAANGCIICALGVTW